uniref:peptidylprolyl isomerase n=1 Tax=uncultured marine thaumarchaeote KM3_40_F03 TaxID=1456143 RepID=A0A075H7A7_9ARCH|nr:peptidyl-prolyl isomerase (PPIB, ppiB) [uncultured marine thaumarchaeote KM3_40_F03]|tara:strand:+ start:114 stop:710 length:597 start_codon:yes stop_codon:yes gene_type:complete
MSSLDNRTLAIVGVVILLAVGIFLFNPFNSNSNSSDNMSDRQIAVIETNLGTIVIQLFPDVAPGHVENFVKLAQDGFYDGTTFHRVIPGFMIQGGDPNSKDDDRSNDGQGGPGYTINAEFSDKPHKRGILSMARAQDPNSAGSQFFIVVADSNFLDGQYTVFGEVIEGMEVADKIVNVEKDGNDNPREKVTMKVTIRS